MVQLQLATDEIRAVLSAPSPFYQAARWIRAFHQLSYLHIGWQDHPAGMTFAMLLHHYGFVRFSRFEYNTVRLLLDTYGPLMIMGGFAHLARNQTVLPISEPSLVRVTSYQDGNHAVILNGYWDAFSPRLLYRDPSYPERQFAVELARLRDRLDSRAGMYYVSCGLFPKPCAHMMKTAAHRETAQS